MAQRPAAALILLARALREAGEQPDKVLARFGLDADRLDPTATIDVGLERRVNEALADALGDPARGLQVGASLGIGSYGPFTLLLLTAADTLAAMRTAIEFQSLSFLHARLGFEPGHRESALVLQPAAAPAVAYRFRIDLDVAGTRRMMRDLQRTADATMAPSRIVMPYPAPREADRYEREFGCPIDWDGRDARLLLPNAQLHARFRTADAAAHAVLRAQCRRMLLALGTPATAVAARVRSHLASCRDGFPTAAEAAALLGTSERSLRRALDAEQTSFRALLAEVRLEKSRRLLEDPRLSVEQVARMVGYSEPAAFIRAFTRWTGATPARFRRATGPVARRPDAGITRTRAPSVPAARPASRRRRSARGRR